MAGRTFKVTFTGDSTDLERAVRAAGGSFEEMEQKSSGLNRAFSNLATTAGGFLSANVFQRIPSILGGFIGASSDLAESLSKARVVFGDSAGVIEEFANTAARSLGMSQQSALEAAGTFGNLFLTMGMQRPAAAEMSQGIVRLASDLASFNNQDPSVVLEKLQSGLVGQAEPLRSLGVNISAAAVETKALEMGLAATAAKLTEADKVTARYALIMAQTTTAQGDFARTADGNANQMRIMRASMADASATLGDALLPTVVTLGQAFLALQPAMLLVVQVVGVAVSSLAAIVGVVVSNWELLMPLFAVLAAVILMVVIPAVVALTVAVLAWVAAMALSILVFAGINAPLLLIALAIGLLITGIILLIRNWDTITEKIPALGVAFDAVRAAIGVAVAWFTDTMLPAIQGAVEGIATAFNAAIGPTQAAVGAVKSAVEVVVNLFEPLIKGAIGPAAAVFEAQFTIAKEAVVLVFGLMETAIRTTLGIIQGVINVAMGILTGDWGRAWDGIKQIVDSIWQGIQDVVGGFAGFIEGVVPDVLAAAAAVGSALLDGLKAGIGAVGGIAGDIAGAITGAIKAFINTQVIDRLNGALQFTIPIPGAPDITINPPDIPRLAAGGIVTRPTLALIGESGPEAVVPLSGGRGLGATYIFSGTVNLNGSAAPAEFRRMAEEAFLEMLEQQFGPGRLQWGVA